MFSNPRFSNEEQTCIDLDMEHPTFGSICFTSSKNDVEEHGRHVFNVAINGGFGAVMPYTNTNTNTKENANASA